MTEYDQIFIFGDVRHIQRLNRWAADQYSGIEIRLKDIDAIQSVNDQLYTALFLLKDHYNNPYFAHTIRELNPQLFNWLDLLDMNVWVILILLPGNSGFTMIPGLLIIILERTRMIGVLKALGARNGTIRCTFLYLSVFLVGKGILLGNILALIIYFAQRQWALFSLDANTYYIDHVPMEMNWLIFIVLNVATFLLSMVMLVGPSYLITHIKPVKAIRFE